MTDVPTPSDPAATGVPTSASPTSVSPTTDVTVSTDPVTVTVVPQVGSPVRWMWPPVFVAPGVPVRLQIIVDGDAVPDAVAVSSPEFPAPVDALHDPSSGRWITEITIPTTFADRRIELTATASLAAATLGTDSLMVPVISETNPIEPSMVDITPTVEAELAFGDADREVGFVPAANDFPAQGPASIGVDPRYGDLVILDAQNFRLVILAGPDRIFRAIQLPLTGWLDELVIDGDTGQATVSQFEVKNRHIFATAYLVDLDTGIYTTSGPIQTPTDPPFGLRMVWSDANTQVYADLPIANGGFFPFYDAAHQTLNMSATGETWLSFFFEDGVGTGVKANGTKVVNRLPFLHPAVEDNLLAPDGTFWSISATVDPIQQGPASVHWYLTHTDPACYATVAAEIELSTQIEFTRHFAVHDGVIYLQALDANGYRVERYELPPITC